MREREAYASMLEDWLAVPKDQRLVTLVYG